FFLNVFIFNFFIKKFNSPTPGRAGNYTDEDSKEDSAERVTKKDKQANDESEAAEIVYLLGGQDNVEDVDACMTRLRVAVKDLEKVKEEADWKKTGALGLVLKDKGVQAIYGPKADVLKSEVQDYLED